MAAKVKIPPRQSLNGTSEATHRATAVPIGTMYTCKFKLIGITPLMQKSALNPVDDDEDTTGQAAAKGPKPTREQQAAASTYPIGDGTFYHPAGAFRSAMIDAASGHKLKKQDGKGTVSAPGILQSCCFNVTEQAILIHPATGKPLTQYTIDTRNAVNANGGMIVTSRPLWNEWAVVVEFEYDPTVLTPETLLLFLNIAGARVGVGNLRPMPNKNAKRKGKGGRYGKFRAELVE